MMDVTLKRLVGEGTVRRLGRGLCEVSKISTLLIGPVSATIDANIVL